MSTRENLIAIVGATVIDGNGGQPIEDGVILIEGKRITAVGDASTPIPPLARRVTAARKYVMPGILDANIHLMFLFTPGDLVRYEDRYEEVIAEAAQIALKNGQTTVFDTWGPREALTRVRDRINGGELVGSRIFFAGNIIGFGGPTSTDFLPISRTVLSKSEADAIDGRWEQGVGAELLWMTPEQLRERIRAYINSGSQDFLKYGASGHTFDEFRFICFSAEAQRVIVEEGHRAGITVQAHSTSPESLRMEIEAGADLLQHGDLTGAAPMPEETLRLIVERKVPCAALFYTRRCLAWHEEHGSEPLKTYYRIKDDNDRRLVAAGAPLLLTTDAGLCPVHSVMNPLIAPWASADDSPIALGEAHFRWLEAAGELGMRPMDALLAATRNIARAYKVDQEMGTIEPGKRADLLVLDKNPLANASHYRSIHLILKDGSLVDRSSLPSQRLLTRDSVSGSRIP